MAERDYTPHQQKIIRRYYDQQPTLLRQRLGELVGDLYLAEGKKQHQLWRTTAEVLLRLGLSQARVDHLVKQADPKLLAAVVKEFESR